MAVDGVGAVKDAVPPVAVVYHLSVLAPALAVRGTEISSLQYFTGVVTMGVAGRGFTVMLKVDSCEQPDATPVTLMSEAIGAAVVFVVVKAGRLPFPLVAGNPIAAVLAVQLMVVPGVELVKLKGPALTPVQNSEDVGMVSCGISEMRNCLVCVVVPHSLVTSSVMLLVPAPEKVTCPGSAVVALAGRPPRKVHL